MRHTVQGREGWLLAAIGVADSFVNLPAQTVDTLLSHYDTIFAQGKVQHAQPPVLSLLCRREAASCLVNSDWQGALKPLVPFQLKGPI